MYSATLLDHFEHPRNSGDLPGANVIVRVENPVCADVLQLALEVVDGTVASARFKAKGCVPCVACASILTEMIRGQRINSLDISANDLIENLGGLPEASSHAAQLSVDALMLALREAAKEKTSVARHG